jgi:serpin B
MSHPMKRGLLSFVLLFPLLAGAEPTDTTAVVSAINALGLDLYRVQPGDGNLLLSPYSIQDALAMTYAGAGGDTHVEMQRVLHYPADDNALHAGFAELARELEQAKRDSARAVAGGKNEGRNPGTLFELNVANQLFAQSGYALLPSFLALVKNNYGAPVEQLDFAHAAEQARSIINDWAEKKTKGKISNLIPQGGVSSQTALILANAIYLHASWDRSFDASQTKPGKFFLHGAESVMAPTMADGMHPCGYLHRGDFTAVSLPYIGGGLQFLILLPDAYDGLPALEREITPALLAECANLPFSEVDLQLPKFKLELPSMALGRQLKQLGLQTAFDRPKGSANFDHMAPRKPGELLCIGAIFHKAFLSLDEEGTEAAAVTTVEVDHVETAMRPISVQVDHPFIFAVQHVPSGECLFLGRVTDPRQKD